MRHWMLSWDNLLEFFVFPLQSTTDMHSYWWTDWSKTHERKFNSWLLWSLGKLVKFFMEYNSLPNALKCLRDKSIFFPSRSKYVVPRMLFQVNFLRMRQRKWCQLWFFYRVFQKKKLRSLKRIFRVLENFKKSFLLDWIPRFPIKPERPWA